MLYRRILPGAICVLGLIASVPVICSEQVYSITEIPQITHSIGVNRDGDVVGEKVPTQPSISAVFFVYVESNGVLNELPTGFSASDINDNGQIVGDHIVNDTPNAAAVLNVSGGETLLTKPSFFFLTLGHAISNSGLFAAGEGLVIGQKGQSFFVPFLWGLQDGSVAELPLLASEDVSLPVLEGDAHAVNDKGVVVGKSGIRILDAMGNPIGTASHAVRWRDGTAKDLGTLPDGMNSDANGINDLGEIVGSSDTGSGASHAYLLRRHKMVDLGTLGHDLTLNSDANRINDCGEIVGWSEIRLHSENSVVRRAFVYRHGHLRDLTKLIERKSSLYGTVTLTSASSISSNGWIAADGYDNATMEPHGYLLIPDAGHGRGGHSNCRR